MREKKYTMISEMSLFNIIRETGSDYYANDFPGTFVGFSFKKFTQEIMSSYADPCL